MIVGRGYGADWSWDIGTGQAVQAPDNYVEAREEPTYYPDNYVEMTNTQRETLQRENEGPGIMDSIGTALTSLFTGLAKSRQPTQPVYYPPTSTTPNWVWAMIPLGVGAVVLTAAVASGGKRRRRR